MSERTPAKAGERWLAGLESNEAEPRRLLRTQSRVARDGERASPYEDLLSLFAAIVTDDFGRFPLFPLQDALLHRLGRNSSLSVSAFGPRGPARSRGLCLDSARRNCAHR